MNPFGSTKISWLKGMAIGVTLVICVPILWIVAKLQLAQGAVQKERRAAQAEHIPTTAAELKRNPPLLTLQNAAPYYVIMASDYTANKEKWDRLSKSAMRITGTQEKAGDAKIARQLLAASTKFQDNLERALKRPDCDFCRKWERGAEVEFPELRAMRHAARLLAMKAELLDRDGKPTDAMKQIEKGGKLAQHSNSDQFLISLLVQIALESILDREWHKLVNRHSNNAAFLDRAAKADAAFGKLPSLSATTRREIANILIMIDLARQGKPNPTDKIPAEVADIYAQQWLEFGRKAVAAMDKAKDDPEQMILVLEPLTRREEATGKFDPTRQFNKDMTPLFLSTAKRLAQMQAMRRMRKLKLELLRYRLAYHAFPADLKAFPAKLTIDPFSGTTLYYERDGAGYRMWSVGMNGVDDGGQKVVGDNKSADVVTSFP